MSYLARKMWRLRVAQRRTRALSYAILLWLAIGFWFIIDHELTRNHYLSTELVDLSSDNEENGQTPLSPKQVTVMCRAHGFPPGKTHKTKKKIYDLVLLSTELDWLEIRLHTLSHYVDYFVIIESPTTFTGKLKPLHLRENWDRFKEFHHMIIYRVVEDPI